MKFYFMNHPSLQLLESTDGISQAVIVGALFGSLEHEDRKSLTSHIETKLKYLVPGTTTWYQSKTA